MPIANPFKCVIPWRKGENIEVNIVDISVGGIGVIAYSSTIQFEPGADAVLHCLILAMWWLGRQSRVRVTLKNNVKTRRSSCEFVDIAPSVQAMIQRYIIKLERDRRAKPGEN